jgi:hypothetical protein
MACYSSAASPNPSAAKPSAGPSRDVLIVAAPIHFSRSSAKEPWFASAQLPAVSLKQFQFQTSKMTIKTQ